MIAASSFVHVEDDGLPPMHVGELLFSMQVPNAVNSVLQLGGIIAQLCSHVVLSAPMHALAHTDAHVGVLPESNDPLTHALIAESSFEHAADVG